MPSIHKKSEDEWFAKHEKDLIKNIQRERKREEQVVAEKMKEEEARKLRELHWMKCPKCGSELKEEEIHAVQVDRCTVCGGVFLDRGELAQLMLIKSEEKKNVFRKLLGILGS